MTVKKNDILNLKDVPKLIGHGAYATDVMLYNLPDMIRNYQERDGLDLNPDFQRGHVWTREQEIAYIEFVLRGGKTALDFFFNHPGWMGDFEGSFVCVDGLQRITAIMRFFDDNVPVFGGYVASRIEGLKRMIYSVRLHINTLQTRREVLQWYVEFNAGGTPHSAEEIERVRKLIDAEPK